MASDSSAPLFETLPILLSFNGGFVDVAGFLALQGLFTAHVTGNFITLGASLVFGTSGAIAKLIALPVFCITVLITRLLSTALTVQSRPALRSLLQLKLALLVVGAALAVRLGPFKDGDAWPAIVTGMVLVSAMAVQNAVHRIHLSSAPPTTLMTGSTTQIMIDLADLLHGGPPDPAAAAHRRLARMGTAVVSFACGSAAGALLFALSGNWCFALPPIIALLALAAKADHGQGIA